MRGEDKIAWSWNISGAFSTSTTCMAISGDLWEGTDVKWELIWKCQVPQRIRHFMWLLICDCEALSRRGMTDDSFCTRCAAGMEDSLCVTKTYTFARGDWIMWNLGNTGALDLLFGLWKNKNEFIFQGAYSSSADIVIASSPRQKHSELSKGSALDIAYIGNLQI
ncbi:hypothetical protein GOBAR_AA25113 [Gossypium barbadense]|uniref:Reverse transcriptase zinc-binding domain-containing protein n=1 Tax=Gossypium barbadense TaxID=3634 RepID=A0A2P5WWT5_GOSBA|nr:hypothetical protein GOBAR_AA25113 [Gossypium barbadense]